MPEQPYLHNLPVVREGPKGPPPPPERIAKFQEMVARVADGELLVDMEREPGMPTRYQLYRYLRRDQALADAYDDARALAGHGVVDELTKRERRLLEGKVPDRQVRAYDIAMRSMQWRAGKLYPQLYGDKAAGTPGLRITINTNVLAAQDTEGQEELGFRISLPETPYVVESVDE